MPSLARHCDGFHRGKVERVAEERMWEKMESDKRLRKEVETMNNEVENVRNMFPGYKY